ncbi:MAG: ABC transporter ATP-binding protein [Clostridia bacterium]|nr:ABC transporter ATP-binding protein [Clostridia bacterium]
MKRNKKKNTPVGIPDKNKPKDFKGTLFKIIKYIASHRLRVVIVLLCSLGGTVFNIVGPKILGSATTLLSEGLFAKIRGDGGIDFESIAQILLRVVLLYIAGYILHAMQGWIMAGVTQKVSYRLRKEISEKINRLPMRYFENTTVGEILSRITNDIDNVTNGLNQCVTQILSCIVTVIGVLIMMLSISPLMTGLTLILLPVSFGLLGLIMKRSQKYFRAQQNLLGELNGKVEETYSGHTVIKAFNREERVIDDFTQTNENLRSAAIRAQFLSGIMHPMLMFIENLSYVGVAVLGSYLAATGSIGVGDIQAFIQYVKNFTQPIQQLAQIGNMLQSMTAAAERVFDFLEAEEEPRTSEEALSAEDVKGHVEFSHVRFGYNEDVTVIKDFSAVAQPGQKIAIVGPTGAGKTTLVKLLMRYYDVNDGCILLDGKDVRSYDRRSLRQAFGMVLQDTWLFKGTIRENIRFGRLDATDEEVEQAAVVAEAAAFIEALPEGYDTWINEEAANLSAGQKQLLTIARAVLADTRLLILDEATSSVDTRTERLLQEAMDKAMQGRTSFVIAHRLSTVRNADLILVVRDGDIVEQGKHEDLLAADGFYAQLYNAQFRTDEEE